MVETIFPCFFTYVDSVPQEWKTEVKASSLAKMTKYVELQSRENSFMKLLCLFALVISIDFDISCFTGAASVWSAQPSTSMSGMCVTYIHKVNSARLGLQTKLS